MSSDGDPSAELRAKILALAAEYAAARWPAEAFVPGQSNVPVSGKVFDARDVQSLVDASLDFWLTTGRFAELFEERFSTFMGVRHCSLVNSGSSANLLGVAALTAGELGARALQPGDEVITSAVGFPTTVNPIVQSGLVPVFVDAGPPTYNPTVAAVEAALGPKTRAIILAHTLGNPFDASALRELADRHSLWLIEDCCDAVGSTVGGAPVGTVGHLATVSFYPAHHITMGEGGAVLTSNAQLRKLVESFRDWGRDCWCDPGCDNTCGKRFDWQLGELPRGFDHKYTYSRIGYNLKLTDMQAAVGVSQLDKLPGFIAKRRANFAFLRRKLEHLEEHLVLPEATPGSDPSWFGFPVTVRATSVKRRDELVQALERARIATRLLFGGNLLRQPAYRGIPCRVPAPLVQADQVMNDSFWVGIYPGLDEAQLTYVADTLDRTLR